jgi:photosystem II stability/assembly factor-like uncharacterized protein
VNRKLSLVLIAVVCLSTTMHAFWTSLPLEGGPIYSGAITAGPDRAIYVTLNYQSSHPARSTDAGDNWGRAACVFSIPPEVILPHPTNPSLLYAASNGLVHKSTDAGDNWTALTRPAGATFLGIDVNPNDWSEVFAAGCLVENGTQKTFFAHSVTGGQAWELQVLEQVSGTQAFSVAIDDANPDVIYVGGHNTTDLVLYKSENHGADWTAHTILAGAGPYNVYAIDVNPANSSVLLAATTVGGFRSDDDGVTWSQVLPYGSYQFAHAAGQPDLVYVAAGGSALRSLDAGLTWSPANNGSALGVKRCILADPEDDDIVYCGTAVGMYKSSDQGANWSPVNNGLRIARVTGIAATNDDDDAVYAASYGALGLHASDDRGNSWSRSAEFVGCGTLCGLAVSNFDRLEVWAQEGSG